MIINKVKEDLITGHIKLYVRGEYYTELDRNHLHLIFMDKDVNITLNVLETILQKSNKPLAVLDTNYRITNQSKHFKEFKKVNTDITKIISNLCKTQRKNLKGYFYDGTYPYYITIVRYNLGIDPDEVDKQLDKQLDDSPLYKNGLYLATIEPLSVHTVVNLHHPMTEIITSINNELLKQETYETYEHCKRVSYLVSKLGSKLGMTSVEIEELELLGYLHDIGKISLKHSILNKPTKLNKEEWVEMKTHPTKGYQIITNTNKLDKIGMAILQHHERIDGKGYPFGLKGNEILGISKMISVVDTFDAMISKRVYKPAMSLEYIVTELKQSAGTQLEPYYVQVFLDLILEDLQFNKKENLEEYLRIPTYTIESKNESKSESKI